MPLRSRSVDAFSNTAVFARDDRGVERVAARDRGAQRLDGGGARDFAALMAAHAVGHRVQRQPVVDEEAVLVAGAELPDVGARAGIDPQRATSSTVCPTWTRSPLRSVRSAVIGRPVDEGAVRRAEVLDEDVAAPFVHACVQVRHERVVGQRHAAARGAADGELAVHLERAAARGGGLDDDEPPGPAGRGPGLGRRGFGLDGRGRGRRRASRARTGPSTPRARGRDRGARTGRTSGS